MSRYGTVHDSSNNGTCKRASAPSAASVLPRTPVGKSITFAIAFMAEPMNSITECCCIPTVTAKFITLTIPVRRCVLQQWTFERPERSAGKLARSVLRGERNRWPFCRFPTYPTHCLLNPLHHPPTHRHLLQRRMRRNLLLIQPRPQPECIGQCRVYILFGKANSSDSCNPQGCIL